MANKPAPKAPALPTPPAPAPRAEPAPPDSDLVGLAAMLERATPEQKELLREALGVKNSVINKPKAPRKTNADVRKISALVGDVYRPGGGGFKPSESIADKGPEAVAAARQRWEEGQTTSSRKSDEMEALAATAHM